METRALLTINKVIRIYFLLVSNFITMSSSTKGALLVSRKTTNRQKFL